jgi:hypothetical protein
MNIVSQVIKHVGSLWWTNVLLLLLALAMGVATAYESTTSTELAQIQYYHTNWFQGLLALLAVNAAASLISHWPWSRRNFGFVLIHGSLVIVLVGAAITRFTAFDGSVGIEEGKSVSAIYDRHDAEVTLTNLMTGEAAKFPVSVSLLDQLTPRDLPGDPQATLDGVTFAAIEYIPDGEITMTFLASSDPAAPSAAEITLTADGQNSTTWLTPDRPAILDNRTVLLRKPSPTDSDTTLGPAKLNFTIGDSKHEIPLPPVNADPVTVGEGGLTVQVISQFKQAVVGKGGSMVEGPGNQSNPAVEVILRRGDDEVRRLLFAKFPVFKSANDTLPDVIAQYTAGSDPSPSADLTLMISGDNTLTFKESPDVEPVAISEGKALKLSDGSRFTLNAWLPHAKRGRGIRPTGTIGKNRNPSLAIRLSKDTTQSVHWLRRNDISRFTFAGQNYRLEFSNRKIDLPFVIQLERFEIGMYPGGRNPRSFSSRVVITDPASGNTRPAVISMNAPVTHDGYTFYQSSYDIRSDRRLSFLSVSDDPGRPVVYFGYVGLCLGMVWVLSTRMRGQAATGDPA